MGKQSIWKRIKPANVMVAVLTVVAVAYLIVQCVNSMQSNIETTPAVYVTMDESISAEGWFVRDETVAEGTSSNSVKHIVSNGEKVQDAAALAIVYEDESIMKASRRMEEIDNELSLLNSAVQSVDNYTNDNTKLDQQITREMQQLAVRVDDGMLFDAYETATELRKLALRRNASSLDVASIKSQIVALENEKKQLTGQASGRSNTISAPASGYFSEVVDGYEEILTPEKVRTMQPETFKQLTEQKVTAPTGKLGKVVSGFTWDFATVLSEENAARLLVGQKVTLKFSQISANADAEVVAINSSKESGEALVIFQSQIMNGELVSIRQQKVDIVVATHSGLRVPVSAITMNDKGETGVLILTGNTARFKYIDEKNSYKGEQYYIVPKGTAYKYLLMNDEIVIHPSGSNNLKVISS